MKIYSNCLLKLLISCIGILQVFISVTAEIPKIDFNGFSQILIPGHYNGISEYNGAPGQKEIFDIASDSIITQSPNGIFQLAGTASYNGTINALCILPRNDGIDVYIGGNFSTLGDVKVNNIARYDPSTRAFSPLAEGLDGPVHSLYCDTTDSIVYVGGEFAAPMNNPNFIDFGGNVAIWRNNAWESLPFKGFNGPVYTIAYNEPNNTIYFGGRFDATGDGLFGEISNTQPINIQNASVTGGNSADREGFKEPSVIRCSVDPDGFGTTWLMRDNIPGFWRAEFSVRVTPSVIGIKNTNFEGRGTKAFRLIATADMNVVTLSYMDPIDGRIKECSNSCPLTPDNVDFQMFTFVGRTELTGIQIDILEWYGAGGGLHGIQLFQSDIIVRAANDIIPSCDQPQPKVIPEGEWTPKLLSGIWKNVLQTTLLAENIATTKVTLQPHIPQAGYYDVDMTTPSCIPFTCSQTTSVDVTIHYAPGQSFGPITISQNNPSVSDKTDSIAKSIFIVATTTAFKPTVEIKPSATAAAGSIITVDSIKFVKSSNKTPLTGLFQYSRSAWNGFNGILAPLSVVRVIKVLSQSSIVIGGKFNNVTFNNIVEYDGTTFIPYPKGGLNGRVNTLEKVENDLLIGGLFNNTVLESTLGLNNIAKLSLIERQWFPVAGGVNGEVEKIALLNNQETQQVHVAGKFNTIITPQANAKGTFGNVTFGYTVWDNKLSNWATASFIDGNINDIASYSKKSPLTFYAGRILSSHSTSSFGGSLLSSSGISALPLYPQALNGNIPKIIINTGLSDTKGVIIGGNFVLNNNITNVAIIRDGSLNNLGNDVVLEGEVKYLTVTDELLYIGSVITEESNSAFNPFIIYDLNERKVNTPPQLTADDNKVRVNIIKNRIGTSEILVGGKFDKAGSLECKTICVWDSNLKQWKTLGAIDSLSGEILSMDLIGKKKDSLVVAGNMTLKGNPVYLLKYDFGKQNWEDIGGNGKLPGPATVVSNDLVIDGQFFVSGYAEDGSVYLHKWIGSKFRNIGEQIKPASRIESLSLLPSNSEHDSFEYLEENCLLFISGSLKLDSIGDVSAALYDGKNMHPYILSSQTNGVPGRIFAIFAPASFSGKRHLPPPVVITISTVIALFLVFLIFASGMSYRYFKRRGQKETFTPIGRNAVKTPIGDNEFMNVINAATHYSMASSNNFRISAVGSNADVKSLDEASAFVTGSNQINQTLTLRNVPPTSIEGDYNNLNRDLAIEQDGSAAL